MPILHGYAVHTTLSAVIVLLNTGRMSIGEGAWVCCLICLPSSLCLTIPRKQVSRPMMLQAIMGTPLLSWLTRSLAAGGVGAFLLVCHLSGSCPKRSTASPDGCELSCAKLEETADQLHVFLSTAIEQEEDVIVVTGPAVIDPFAVDEEAFSGAPVESGVSSVSRQALMDALDDTFIFTDFMKEHGIPYTDRDGVYAVSSMQQLAGGAVLSRGVLYDLAAPQGAVDLGL